MPTPDEPTPLPGPLADIVLCAKCGHAMHLEALEVDGDKQRVMYRCLHCGNEDERLRLPLT